MRQSAKWLQESYGKDSLTLRDAVRAALGR